MVMDVVVFVAALLFIVLGGVRVGWCMACEDQRLDRVCRRDGAVCDEAERDT